MKTKNELRMTDVYAYILRVISRVSFRNWTFKVGDKNGVFYLQVVFSSPDNHDPKKVSIQHCRKWQLSEHMTTSEIVATAWMAVEQAVKHEAAEQFTYRGEPIYDFHLSADRLAQLRSHPDCLDLREEETEEPTVKRL